jgi:hypothetical protein
MRLGIVVSVLGGLAGGIRGYFLAADAYALSNNGFRQESALVDYAVASLLPVLGFWAPLEVILFLVWIGSSFSEQPDRLTHFRGSGGQEPFRDRRVQGRN